MFIVPVVKENSNYAKQFVQKYEFFCVQLAYYLRKEEQNIYIITSSKAVDTESIYGVFYLKSTLFHCIPNFLPEIQNVLQGFLNDKKVFCIHGVQEVSEKILDIILKQKCILKENIQTVHYNLMNLQDAPKNPPQPLYNGEQILRCTMNSLDALYQLQYNYLKQEVVPNNKKVSDLECKISLKQILKNQIVLALFSDDEPVAKANTNAIGFNCVQIGGVYTEVLYRRNYYAWHLLYVLCSKIRKNNKIPVLFVKTNNQAAINMYEKIGFNPIAEFEIIYL